jgi:hypothetical protein
LARGDKTVGTLAAIGGVPIELSATRDLLGTSVEFRIKGVVTDPIRLSLDELRQTTSGLLTKLENRVHNLDRDRDDLLARAVEEDRQASHAEDRIGRPFEYEERLNTLTERLAQIDAELAPPEEDVALGGDPKALAVVGAKAETPGGDVGL